MTRLRSRILFAVGPMVMAGTLMAAPPQALKGWGQSADPDGDCRFELKEGKLVISVPGTVHNLAAADGQLNAPTVLSPIRGEFIAMVKSTGDVRPGPEPSIADGLPYQGTGLLLWADRDNYIRLERAGMIRNGEFVTYLNFEHFKDGQRAFSQGLRLKEGASELRLERRAGKIHASVSQDGVRWMSFPPLDARLPDEIKVGVAAVNSSKKPFSAELEDLSVFTRREIP